MTNVLQVNFEREFGDEFMQSLFNLCDTGIEYWAFLDTEKGGTEYYDDEKKIIIAINVYEGEGRVVKIEDGKQVATVSKRDGEWRVIWRIDGLTFMKGIERIMSGEVEVRDDLFTNIVYAAVYEDDSRLDPECVDTIVQAGLYNELVWG